MGAADEVGAAVVVGAALVGAAVVVAFAVLVGAAAVEVALLVPNAATSELYAALGLKLESKSSGVMLARHESLSLIPQEVIPMQFLTARQPFMTCR